MDILFKKKKIVLHLTFFLTMAISMLFITSSQALAAPATVYSTGFVEYQYLINKHPDTVKANDILRTEVEQAKKEFLEKSASMSEQEKRNFDLQLGQRIEQKRQELLRPIVENINATIKEVADTKRLSVVVGKHMVIYGGVDITDEVLKKIIEQHVR